MSAMYIRRYDKKQSNIKKGEARVCMLLRRYAQWLVEGVFVGGSIGFKYDDTSGMLYPEK